MESDTPFASEQSAHGINQQRENKGKSSDKKRIPTANPPAFQKSDTNKKIDEIAIWNLQAVFLNRIADHAKQRRLKTKQRQ
jgi:hypothetical protein